MKSNKSAKTKEKNVLLLDRAVFLRWIFSDYDDRQQFFDRYSVLETLISEGEFRITDTAMLDAAGYIPQHVVHKSQKKSVILDKYDEVDTSQYDEIRFYKRLTDES